MKSHVFLCASMTIALVLLSAGGCISKADFDKCSRLNEIQRVRIEDLLANQENARIEADACRQELELTGQKDKYWQQQLKALEAALQSKNALVAQLTSQLGQITIPVALSNALADWARQSGTDLVDYNETTGMVRFKSDLLFDEGDDTVQPEAKERLEALSEVLNSPVAEGFDVLIVGHTDDMRIGKPATRAKHPTNWHLSAHRAIAVEKVLAQAGMTEVRMVVMGMGQFRPIEPNEPKQQGNPKNRRVEIYIVPAGQMGIASPTATL